MEVKEIKNLIQETQLLNWVNLKPFQPENLKTLTKDNYEKLRNSLIKNNFIAGFHVWKFNDEYLLLDGHHRRQVLIQLRSEGYIIPDLLTCNIVDVKDKLQAIEFLLTYSSEYAHLDKEGVTEFLYTNNLDIDFLSSFVELPGFKIEELKFDHPDFEAGNVDEQGKLDEKKPIICPNCDHSFVP